MPVPPAELNQQDEKKERKRWSLIAWLRHAFAIEPYDESSLSEDDKEVLHRIARRLHERRLSAAAILWAESHRNFNFVGSQLMVAAQPVFDLTQPLVNAILQRFGTYIPPEDYPRLAAALEKRYSIEYFIQQLEAYAAGDYNMGSLDASAAGKALKEDSAPPENSGAAGADSSPDED